jgi:hypothetical protein
MILYRTNSNGQRLCDVGRRSISISEYNGNMLTVARLVSQGVAFVTRHTRSAAKNRATQDSNDKVFTAVLTKWDKSSGINGTWPRIRAGATAAQNPSTSEYIAHRTCVINLGEEWLTAALEA